MNELICSFFAKHFLCYILYIQTSLFRVATLTVYSSTTRLIASMLNHAALGCRILSMYLTVMPPGHSWDNQGPEIPTHLPELTQHARVGAKAASSLCSDHVCFPTQCGLTALFPVTAELPLGYPPPSFKAFSRCFSPFWLPGPSPSTGSLSLRQSFSDWDAGFWLPLPAFLRKSRFFALLMLHPFLEFLTRASCAHHYSII